MVVVIRSFHTFFATQISAFHVSVHRIPSAHRHTYSMYRDRAVRQRTDHAVRVAQTHLVLRPFPLAIHAGTAVALLARSIRSDSSGCLTSRIRNG